MMKNGLLKATCNYFNVTKEFILSDEIFRIDDIPVYSIEQNVFSLSFLLKSLFYSDSSAIFLTAVINLFQKLNVFDACCPFYYEGYSHGLTLYCLRILEKHNIVKIIIKHNGCDIDLNAYYKSMGNSLRQKSIRMYDIVFCKIRDFTESDIDLMYKLITSFHVNGEDIVLKSVNGKLHAGISWSTYGSNLVNGIAFSQIGKRIFSDRDSFKEGCIYLKRSGK